MSSAKDRLENLKTKRDQLNARIQKLQASEKMRERKRDTRRKILVGAYFLKKATKEKSLNRLYEIMLNDLKRETDRKLFTDKEELSTCQPTEINSLD